MLRKYTSSIYGVPSRKGESYAMNTEITLGDVGSSKLRDLERSAGPGHEKIQGLHQANPKHLARITKEPVGGKSSDAPDTKRDSDFKLNGIPEPIIR
ncbi:predicted protein [Botrytis cinerea T4]|uniref:Uncharacterized protein n=1 Tax=Botryotinia fuckeliana (strain T4) TaxID=999810 RepID=G2XR69_BOTF4|nr:predicted protein [Botrytis cinerea T4]